MRATSAKMTREKLLMTDPQKDIDRLHREIDDVRTDADRASKGAGMLVVLDLSVSLESRKRWGCM
tara:strand:- start:22 stop:216 length:195 start_codon:yes stop_codon:yes gene_type:complete